MADVIFSPDDSLNRIEQIGSFITGNIHSTDILADVIINDRTYDIMAASRPSPFSRLYFFNDAFESLVALEESDDGYCNYPYRGYAFRGIRDYAHELRPTINHYAVADCLDLLEFLFYYGPDPRLVIERWDAADLERLRDNDLTVATRDDIKSVQKRHKLYNALIKDTINGRVGDCIYIFKWVDDGKDYVIGGTSPFTLVYTAPSWRHIKPKNIRFCGAAGNILFNDEINPLINPVPLYARSVEFRKYLYGLLDNFAQVNTNAFFRYIALTQRNYDNELSEFVIPRPSFDAVYNDLRSPDGPVVIKAGHFDIPLKVYDYISIDRDSDYLIAPTVENVTDECSATGEVIDVADRRRPLVISSDHGINGGGDYKYWYDIKLDIRDIEFMSPSKVPYYERTLPSVPGAVVYPNLRAEDFFEDKIIKTSCSIDRKYFITGVYGSSRYLLPIKPVYFKYFRPEDLKRHLIIDEIDKDNVSVELTIPVKGGTVTLKKRYSNDPACNVQEIVLVERFNLAIFPFYRLEGDDAKYNCYEVMLGDDGCASLMFYNDDINGLTHISTQEPDAQGVTQPSDICVSDVASRTTDDTPLSGIHTTYYKLGMSESSGDTPTRDGSFRFIQARFDDGLCAIIVPDWSQAPSQLGPERYVFCVDFGLSYTNIAYAPIKFGEIRAGDLRDFEYEYGEQVVTLSEYGSEDTFRQFETCLRREFVPRAIGNGADVSFPIRTIINEGPCDNPDQMLFGDKNIAFYPYRDFGIGHNNISEVPLSSGLRPDRISAFFTQLMWMIKNKVVNLGGSMDFKFVFTYPTSMQHREIALYAELWRKARLAVRGGLDDVTTGAHNNCGGRINNQGQPVMMTYEGTANWYHTLSYYPLHESSMIIDIGGNHTDVTIVRPDLYDCRVAEGFNFSFSFAANDLWGRGYDIFHRGNGFLDFYMSTPPGYTYRHENPIFDHPQLNYRLHEAVTCLLDDDSKSKFSDVIRNDKKMRSLVLLHFAAIIYYVGRVMTVGHIKCPQRLILCGLGSKYINIISCRSAELTDLVHAILDYASSGNLEIPSNFKVDFTCGPNPKSGTAQGGAIMWNAAIPGNHMPVVNVKKITVYGFEKDGDVVTPIKATELSDRWPEIMRRMQHFIDMFQDREIEDHLSDMDFGDLSHLEYAHTEDLLKSSLDNMILQHNREATDDYAYEVTFFWPLKYAIDRLAK